MSNWFIGVEVPARGWYPERVPSPPAALTAFSPEDLHLTIAFLGPVGEERARAAWDALAWPLGAVAVSLGGVVPMGNPRRYSALSATLQRGAPLIEGAMGASRDRACAAAGVEPDARPPKAHVTVARPKRAATPRDREAGVTWAKGLRLEGIELVLDTVALYTWSLDRSARLFRQVERRPAEQDSVARR